MEKIYTNIVNEDFINAKSEIRGVLYSKIHALMENRKSELAQALFNEACKKDMEEEVDADETLDEATSRNKDGKRYRDRSRSYDVGYKVGKIIGKSRTLKKAASKAGKGYKAAVEKQEKTPAKK